MRTISEDEKKFGVLMAVLGTAFGDGIRAERIDIYWENLRDIPVDVIGHAVKRIIKKRKYPTIPTIAEIREAALGSDDEIETAALEAWGRASWAVERGQYPVMDELINEAVMTAFGGWRSFGECDPEQGMADRAHFLRVFKGLARKRRDMGRPALLPAVERPRITAGGKK